MAAIAGIHLQSGLAAHRDEQVKTLKIEAGRTELRVVNGPDDGRIHDHELVAAVRRIAGNGTGDTRWKAPGVLVIVYPGTGIQENLADEARMPAIRVWRVGRRRWGGVQGAASDPRRTEGVRGNGPSLDRSESAQSGHSSDRSVLEVANGSG